MKRIPLLLLFVPSLLFAAALSQKYKDWAASPQAYFMTMAEHEQWAAIKTDEEAEQFVNRFLASRGAVQRDGIRRHEQREGIARRQGTGLGA
jgi:hypothetical protein